MALTCVGANAQVETSYKSIHGGYLYGIPKQFNYYNDESHFVIKQENENYDVTGFEVYDTNINLVKEIKTIERTLSLNYRDMDGNSNESTIYLTQTLFNNDEKFEYIVSVPSNDDDYYYAITGFKIVSDDNEVLQTITFEKNVNNEPDLVKIGNNLYIGFRTTKYDEYFLYKINKSSDPSKVSVATTPMRVSVSPRVTERNQDITVIADGDGIKDVVVTNAAGQVVYSTKVAAGQQTVKINSRQLSSGLNVVNIKGANGKSENCKVIVKK